LENGKSFPLFALLKFLFTNSEKIEKEIKISRTKKMIFQELDWTISLGIWIGILTVVVSFFYTIWQIRKGGK